MPNPLDRPKVLLVDDAVENLQILKTILQPLLLDFFIACNGQDALAISERESFDLILLDIKMPDIDGFEVCRQIKKRRAYKDIPILFISSLHSMEDKMTAFDAGGDDYLTKPLYPKEVRARVVAHLQHQMVTKSLRRLLKQSYHELFNPLAVINSSVALYTIKHGENHYIDTIAAASKTLEVIYEDFSRSFSQNAEQKEEIDLALFIEERIAYFDLLARLKNIRFASDSAAGITVFMERRALMRIVDNTLSNAVKYAFADSQIKVSVRRNEGVPLFRCVNEGVTIKDTTKIFSAGYQESAGKIGMGIGLELVAYLCKENSIGCDVESHASQTSFSYRFFE